MLGRFSKAAASSAGAIALSFPLAAATAVALPAAPLMRSSAVDGDTVRTPLGDVRVLGFDTPEVGQCGYRSATSMAARLVGDGVRLHGRSGRDRYGRILAHVRLADGRDLGAVMIRKGLAVARYDSLDGYGWHRYQSRYHRIDDKTPNICGFDPTRPRTSGGKVYYPNCDAVRRAGAAPVYRGQPGYGSHLDRDGDGAACE